MGTTERYPVIVPDYWSKARALRAKAADPVVPPAEAEALRAKADELDAKYGNSTSPPVNDTTVTSRDGREPFNPFARPPGWRSQFHYSDAYWDEVLRKLKEDQWQWNTEYYDRDGNPKPQRERPDVDNIYEESYKYAENEDEGYEEYQ